MTAIAQREGSDGRTPYLKLLSYMWSIRILLRGRLWEVKQV